MERQSKIFYKRILLIMTIILILTSSLSFADNTFTKEYIIKESEVAEFEQNKLKNDIKENGKDFKFVSFEKEIIESSKKETKVITETGLNNNSRKYLENLFSSEIEYNENGYKGSLKLVDFDIEEIKQGKYEEIDTKEIILDNLNENDLDKIEKEIIIDNTTYYLIKTNWSASENQVIDNFDVPMSYKATSTYQAVLTKTRPSLYDVKANYEGTVEKVDKEVQYKVEYQEKVLEIIKPKENKVIPIVLSGFGILGILLLGYLFKGNAELYNNIDGEFKKIGKIRINKNKKINLNKYAFKTKSNNYKLVIKDNTFKKLRNESITFTRQGKETETVIKMKEFKFNV